MNTENNDLGPDEFAAAFKNRPDAVLIDVRTPEEFESGHLPGAININVQGSDFHEQVDDLDPMKPYFVYCKAGARSSAAMRYMLAQGFNDVHNLVGGIMAWNGEIA